MKFIVAIIQPDRLDPVLELLEKKEIHLITVTNVMGRSELDLRAATMAPGAEATGEVFSMMGPVIVRVPPGWVVDTGGLPAAMGAVNDDRCPVSDKDAVASTGPPPRLVLRGLVLMGRLVIAS